MLNAITSVFIGYIKKLCVLKKISQTDVKETKMCGYRCVKHREQGINPNTCSDINANNIIVKEMAPNDL